MIVLRTPKGWTDRAAQDERQPARERPGARYLPSRRDRPQPRPLPADGTGQTASNRLSAVLESTDKAWLEGYLLTGRHGLFNCCEAFVHIVDSMLNQHAKWLTSSGNLP